MRYLITALLMLMLAPVSVTDPGNETNVYEVRYVRGALNTRVAKATLSLAEDEWEEQPAYRADITIKVAAIFRLFMKTDYIVTARYTRPGMLPLYYYSQEVKKYGECHYGEELIHFSRQMDRDAPVEEFDVPNDGKSFELLSMLMFARRYDFEPEVPVPVKILMFGDAYHAQVTLQGTDETLFPGHKAEVLVMEVLERGLFENKSGQQITVWRDAEGSRPILGLEINLHKAKVVCKVIDKKK